MYTGFEPISHISYLRQKILPIELIETHIYFITLLKN